MTSKISLCKQIRQDSRHQLWIPVLACLVYLIGLISLALYYQSSVVKQPIGVVRHLFSSRNVLLTAVPIAGAVICGMALFAFLFSKSQSDFYHKLPMGRTRLFVVRWLEGLLYYLMPTMGFYVLAFVVSRWFGFNRVQLAGVLADSFLRGLIQFSLFYHTAILSAVLCGQVLVALCAIAVLSVYGFAISMLVPVYINTFTETYRENMNGIWSIWQYLSPAWLTVRYSADHLMCWCIAFSAVLWVISLLLYRIRPAERAGSALAFTKTRGIIRIMISVCLSLYIGLLLSVMTDQASIPWLFIGTLLSLLILHGIMETIFDFSVKSALHHPLSLLGSAAFCLCFITAFVTGMLHLDDRLPNMQRVSSASLSMNIEGYHNYLGDDMSELTYYDNMYLQKHAQLKGEDVQKLYALLDSSHVEDSERTLGFWVDVDFQMHSGRTEKRMFHIDKPSADQALAAIFNETDYPEAYYQILSLPDELLNTMTVYGAVGSVLMRDKGNELFNAQETKEFLSIYREELRSLTYEEISVLPTAALDFSLKDSYYSVCYYLYPSQTKSLAWLKKQGIDPDGWKKENFVVEVLDYTDAGGQLPEELADAAVIRLAGRLEWLSSWEGANEEMAPSYAQTSVMTHVQNNGEWSADNKALVHSTIIDDPDKIAALLPKLTGVVEAWTQVDSYVFTDRLKGMDTDRIVRIYTDADELDLDTDSGYAEKGLFVLKAEN